MTKTIYIDPRHGGTDPGAVSGSFIESEVNLKAALAARDYLAAYDCEVILSRTGSTNTKVSDTTAKAKKAGAAAAVAIHHNAGGGDGCEAFYWHTDPRAKELAGEIIKQFKLLGQNSRGVKASSEKAYNFGVCRINAQNGIPAVLGEFAFLDNAADRQAVDSDEKIKAEGEAYAKALVNSLKLEKKKPPASSPVPGKKVRLNNAKLYASASAALPARRITGDYWLYDGRALLNRYRITNAAANAGKLPMVKYVTGWVDAGDTGRAIG